MLCIAQKGRLSPTKATVIIMCTAISINGESHLFGRTLDVECSFGEAITVSPRRAALNFRHGSAADCHHAILGIGCVSEGFPLYFDAVNEHGLAAAGLNFPCAAVYRPPLSGTRNIASFEFIPWLLSNAKSLTEARGVLEKVNITSDSFSPDMPATPLHFMISHKSGSLVIEPTAEGLRIYENPLGIMTNAPEFSFHLKNAAQFAHLSADEPEVTNGTKPFSKGFGAIGLPGDFSSASRFVRAAFAKAHTESNGDDVGRFFHIADTVKVPLGCERTVEGKLSFTAYTCCIDTENRIYHTTTYSRRAVRITPLADFDIDGDRIFQKAL